MTNDFLVAPAPGPLQADLLLPGVGGSATLEKEVVRGSVRLGFHLLYPERTAPNFFWIIPASEGDEEEIEDDDEDEPDLFTASSTDDSQGFRKLFSQVQAPVFIFAVEPNDEAEIERIKKFLEQRKGFEGIRQVGWRQVRDRNTIWRILGFIEGRVRL